MVHVRSGTGVPRVDRVDDPGIVPRASVGLTSDVDWALTYVAKGGKDFKCMR